MTPETLQRIGEIYLALNYGPAPLRVAEVAARQTAKAELHRLCTGGTYSPWRTDFPDDEMTVLVCSPDADEPVWPGYRMDGVWYWADGMQVSGDVVGWTHFPEPPAKSSVAKTESEAA